MLGAALIALGLGGAAGASTPPVAHLGSTESTSTTASEVSGSNLVAWVAYNACLTDHGLPSTTPKNGGSLLNGPSTPSSMAAATAACRKLAPPGVTPHFQRFTEAQIEAWLTYAACMRKHGVPNYPDPRFMDNDTRLILGQDVDYHSPLVEAALTACKNTYPN